MAEFDPLRALGGRVSLETGGPFQVARAFDPGPGPIETAFGTALATTNALTQLGRFRDARERHKLELQEVKKAMQRREMLMEGIRNSIEIGPDGRPSINPKKLRVNAMMADPIQGVKIVQQLDQMELQQARAQMKTLQREQDLLFKRRQDARAEKRAARLPTLEERAAAGDAVAEQGLARRAEERSRALAEQQRLMTGAIAGREEAKEAARRQVEADIPVIETLDNPAQYLNTETGNPIDQSLTTAEFREGIREGRYRKLPSTKEAGAHQLVLGMIPLLEEMKEDLLTIYGEGGIFDDLKAAGRFQAGVKGAFARAFQTDDRLVTLVGKMESNVDNLRRNFQGQVGTQTERDAERGLKGFPRVSSFVPDTKKVAFSRFNTLLNLVNGMVAARVNNKDFRHPRLLPLQGAPPAAPATSAAPAAPARQESAARASAREQLRATGMSDEEIDAEFGKLDAGVGR